MSAGLAANTSNGSTVLVNTSEDEKKEDLPDDVIKFANETKNIVLDTLRNMTGYLPINIIYAETVGRNCNIIQYNKDYYSVPGLVIAALLFLIGVLFCFLGKKYLLPPLKYVVVCTHVYRVKQNSIRYCMRSVNCCCSCCHLSAMGWSVWSCFFSVVFH